LVDCRCPQRRRQLPGDDAAGGAGLLSYGNNQVTGNASNGSFTGSASQN
jgi:hypothetical protein